jgi:hypothetical protein
LVECDIRWVMMAEKLRGSGTGITIVILSLPVLIGLVPTFIVITIIFIVFFVVLVIFTCR